MSLELQSDYISGSEGHYDHIYADHFTLNGGVDLLHSSDTGNFVSDWETGNFITTSDTGNFVSKIGDLSDVATAGASHTPDEGEVLTWDVGMGHWMPKELETGNFVSKWETGDHGGGSTIDTGNFVSNWETGSFVSKWETGDHGGGSTIDTGNFVSKWETGALTDHPINWAVTPASTGSTGVKGDVAFDTGYMYVCITDNKWRRGPLSEW